MSRDTLDNPSNRHLERSCGVVRVLVRYTRAPSMTQISVRVPPLSILMSLSPRMDSTAAFIVAPSSVAQAHERHVGEISVVNDDVIHAGYVPAVGRTRSLEPRHAPRLAVEHVQMRAVPHEGIVLRKQMGDIVRVWTFEIPIAKNGVISGNGAAVTRPRRMT